MRAYLSMSVLLATIAAVPACGDLGQADLQVDSVAYAPDGTLVVFTNAGTFLFTGEGLETPARRTALDGLPSLGHPEQYKYSLAADGTVAAVAYSAPSSDRTTVARYRVGTGEMLNRFVVTSPLPPMYTNRLVDFALSPTGDLLAFTGWNGELTVVDATTGTPLWTADGAQALPVWSRDGATVYAFGLVVSTGEYSLRAYDARAGLKWSQPFETWGWALGMLADGSMLAGITFDDACPDDTCTRYAFWSPVDGTLLSETPGGGGYPASDGRPVFSCSATDNVCAIQNVESRTADLQPVSFSALIYRADRTEVARVPIPTDVASLPLSPDGQFVAAGGLDDDNTVRVYRIADGTQVGSYTFVAADVL